MAATTLDETPAAELEEELFEVVERFSYSSKIVNGGIAGIVGVSCVFPLDLIKTRLQNQSNLRQAAYSGIIDCARKTYKRAGPSLYSKVTAFYQGSSVNVLLITPEKAIKLVANDFFRHQLASPGEKKLGPFRGMLAGGLAGLCQVVVTTPMELLKIRMQQSESRLSGLQLVRSLISGYGFSSLYKGLGPTLARDVSFSVVYFPLFAQLDSMGPRRKDGSGDAVFWASFVSGLASAGFASFVVTPLDVIKTRIQAGASAHYCGVPDAFVKILRTEGPTALFKGAGCRMMVMAPLFGIAQMVYFIGVAQKLGIGV